MPGYGFTASERCQTGVKGLVEADSIEEAKAKIDAGDVYDCVDNIDVGDQEEYNLIDIWEYKD